MISRIYKIFTLIVILGLSAIYALVAVGRKEAYEQAIRNNYVTAVIIWKPLAFLGFEDAQFNLGLSYSKGRGTDKDVSKAVYWYKKAAENGNPAAQYNLADHYRTGEGISQDYKQSLVLLRKAAEKNYHTAQNNLGMMYAEGKGTEKDLLAAAIWFNVAMWNGSESAKSNLSNFEREMTDEQLANAKEAAKQWIAAHPKKNSGE